MSSSSVCSGSAAGQRFEQLACAAVVEGQKYLGGGQLSRAVLAAQTAAQILDEVGPSS
jgi:hypothetical protein